MSTILKEKGRVLQDNDPLVAARYKYNDIFSTAWLGHAISALARTGVPDVLGDEPCSSEVIAGKLGLHAPSLYRVLRAVAANGIFIQHSDGRFSHNDVSELLKSVHPYSWKGMACMWTHPSCLQGWSAFAECLKDGQSGIQHAFGKSLYQHLEETPGGTLAFSDAMISNSAHPAISIAREFPFGDYREVMDLGGGIGTLLCTILEEHKHLRGVIYEIAELRDPAQQYIAQRNLSDRASVEVGDFLEVVPAGPDLFMVKNSLWNWTDEQCDRILRNVHRACIELKGKLLIIEYVIDQDNAPWSTLYDLQILNMPGGRARTLQEYTHLLRQNNFNVNEVRTVEDETLILASPV